MPWTVEDKIVVPGHLGGHKRSLSTAAHVARCRIQSNVLVIFMLLALPGPSLAVPLKADRAWFFQQCGVLHRYTMSGTVAVSDGMVTLSDPMKAGLNHLFDAWERFGDADLNRLAFVLATARRESSGTFEPVREAPRCGTDEACRERVIGQMLAQRARKSDRAVRANYALPDANGQRYYGRGFLQLTLRENYQRTGDILGMDLVSDPDKALDPHIAGEVLVRAMLEGWYGSRRPLSAYIDGGKLDWIKARNNVNPGSPKKPVTASYAQEFAACLRPRTETS